jgi:succinate dehydrogenase / fumarate reductase cytochrome b subunit
MAAPYRPLSPHLQIYRFTITMAMSIVHRITGMALYVGMLVLVAWLLAAAIGGGAYDALAWLYASWLGQLVLFGYTWALFHHLLGGVRHFVWDTIHGLEPGQREGLAWATLAGSIVLTLLVWLVFAWWPR